MDVAEFAAKEGLDDLDTEVIRWISEGFFDDEATARAEALGWIAPNTPYSELDRPLFNYEV